MKTLSHIISLTALLVVSCSTQELEPSNPETLSEDVFYARIEDASGKDTKAFVDDKLRVLWDENDHIAIFDKNTTGQEYRFDGQTGDNAGSFLKVGAGSTGSGHALDLIYAVYPYREETKIGQDGVLSVSLPAEQAYQERSFGPGANTMVSCTSGNNLLFKNLCGYLMLKLYGENVSVAAISLQGNNGEPLAGVASIRASVNDVPVLSMGSETKNEITLTFDTPVTLGTTAETATVFWVVVPPTTFRNGITVTVKDDRDFVFSKTTTSELEISRNNRTTMSALEIMPRNLANMVLYYTSSNGRIVTPNAPDVFGAKIVSNEYVNGRGVLTFDDEVTGIGDAAFENCSNLASITIPESVTRIGTSALAGCTSLESITVLAQNPPTGAPDMFNGTNDCPVYVPLCSLLTYKAAEYWEQYAGRIKPLGLVVSMFMKQTKGNKPVDICVISEGFKDEERELFNRLATEGVNFLFATEPYKTYKDYFNVYFLSVPSQDSGASILDENGNITTQRNTAFSTKWGELNYSNMSADEDLVYGFVQSACPEIADGSLTIQDVPILMIINDSRYGGLCHSYGDGRGLAMVPYTRNGEQLYWEIGHKIAYTDDPVTDGNYHYRTLSTSELNAIGKTTGSWKNILLHEFGGHCFARFMDEYWNDTSYYASQSNLLQHYYSVPFGLNVSGRYDETPWNSLLEIRDNLVTIDTNYGRIGRYQGADNSMFNRWRSEIISCMYDNRPYFSTWQRILIVRRIMEKAGMEFSSTDFFDKDVTVDPIRDQVSGAVLGFNPNLPVYKVPLLPPPVVTE